MSFGGWNLVPGGSNAWRNRLFAKVFAILCCFGILALLGANFNATFRPSKLDSDTASAEVERPPVVEETRLADWDSSLVLRGGPTPRFRDNLLESKKYITSFVDAGWTNDVMTYINLIYLGILTERIPILATFIPSHISNDNPLVPFGEVFDLPRLRAELRMPILEWQDVKLNSSKELDEVGCWNTWEVSRPPEAKPRPGPGPWFLGLDISYTRAPEWIKLLPADVNDLFLSFYALAALAFPEQKKEVTTEPIESQRSHVKLPPDDQMLCFDYLYFVSAHLPMEYDFEFSPAWRFVGQYLHWTPKIDALAEKYVRRAIGVVEGEKTPTWIAIHLRHGDFKNVCPDQTMPLEDCFAPLPVVARRVDEVKEELLEKKGIKVDHVIMTSDERNATWWEDVRKLGWYQIDHVDTVEKHGAWYPIFIDAAIQAGGMGFVGTSGSTMSILARRRVQSWRDGAVRTVKWGRPGADDH